MKTKFKSSLFFVLPAFVFLNSCGTDKPEGSTDSMASDTAVQVKSTETNSSTTNTQTAQTQITASLDGKAWNAAVVYQGALFYEGGISMLDKSGKPYMQLAFQSNEAPDDRQLTIQIRDFSGKAGKIDPKQMEILLSGSATGDKQKPDMSGYKDDPENSGYTFELEITDWKRTSNETATLSGTFTGKLKGVFGTKDVVIANGKIDNIAVTVHTGKY